MLIFLAELLIFPHVGIAQEMAPSVAAARSEATTNPAESSARDALFGFDDLMTWLIQPRHIKLYYAGKKNNWELAAAELRDLRSGFARLAQNIPKYLNNDVAQAVNVMIAPQIKAVDAAIAAADPKQFTAAYDALTTACNACHLYMEHPYIIMHVPETGTNSAYPDQNFRVRP